MDNPLNDFDSDTSSRSVASQPTPETPLRVHELSDSSESEEEDDDSTGPYQSSKASSPQHSQFSPETPTAIISLLRAKNKENLEAWHQECEMHLKYLVVMQKTWSDNDLRKEFQNVLSEAIEHFKNRLMFIDQLQASEKIVEAAQKTFEEKQQEYEMEGEEKRRMEEKMKGSFSKDNDAEKLRNEYLEYSKNFTDAFLETHRAKTKLSNQKSIWNETANKFNEAGTQLKAKNESYQILEEKWSSLMSVLNYITNRSSDPQNDVLPKLSLMEKILQTPTLPALKLNLEESLMIYEIKTKGIASTKVPSNGRIISYCCLFTNMDWDDRYSLAYYTEKENSAMRDLIPILEILKSQNFRREFCEILTEAVALQTEKMDQITKLKVLADSVCEAEAVLPEKTAKLEMIRRLNEEGIDEASGYFTKEDYASYVDSCERLGEQAKKLVQAQNEVQTKNDDLNMQKEAIDEMVKQITEIEETFVKNQTKLMKLEKNWLFIEKIILSLETKNHLEVDKEKKNQLLVKFLESPLLISEQLDPNDEALLKSFTTKFFGILGMPSEEPSEDEPARKKGRMESEE
ncbi:unnamed protein product [Caenorhabditis nigoni]